MPTSTLPVSVTTPAVAFTVHGQPVTQGSKRAFALRKGGQLTGRVVVVDDNKAPLKTWRSDVVDAARAALAGREPLDGPVAVEVTFYLPRPKSEPKTRRTWPVRKPDADKLLRAALDAFTAAGLYRDDAQVVELRARKDFAGLPGGLAVPGMVASVGPLDGAA